MHAMKNNGKIINKSVSPSNYDNGLGYAPRTIRLFNNRKNFRDNSEKQGSGMTRIGGKVMHKDNVFASIASSTKGSGRNTGRFRLALNTGKDYTATGINATNSLMHRHSMHAELMQL